MASARNSGITRTWQPTFFTSANADDIERAPSKSRHFKDMRVKWCCNLRDPMSIADLVRNLWVKAMAPITGSDIALFMDALQVMIPAPPQLPYVKGAQMQMEVAGPHRKVWYHPGHQDFPRTI